MTATGDVVVASGAAAVPVVQARALLDESERLWSVDVLAAVQETPSSGERHRRRLVLDALAAYERLRAARAPSSDPVAVFLRWPACTVVALSREGDGIQPIVYATADIPAERWLAGWVRACARLGVATSAGAVPGTPAEAPVPELALDPERGALVVTYGTADGAAVTAAGGRPCVPDGDRWVIPRPTPAVTCEGSGDAHRLRVVDMTDPLLLFAPAGALLPLDRPLPPSEAWMLHYGPPAQGWYEGSAQILEHRPPPVGWSRWWLARIDLTDATAVRSAVDHGAEARHGPWHAVAAADRSGVAAVEFEPALAGVTGPDGEPVYAGPPRIRLAGSATWTVSVTEAASMNSTSMTARGGETVVLGDGLPRPLLGRYQARAAGGGRPVAASFLLAEGIGMTPSCQVRVLRPGGGLHTARVAVDAPRGMRAEPRVVVLGRQQRARPLTLTARGRALELQVTVPHAAVREHSAEGHGPWLITPLELTLITATDGRWLDVRLPAALRSGLTTVPPLAAVDRAGRLVQQVPGGRVGTTDVQRYRLDRLADTVRAHGDLRLRLDLPGQDTVVATVRGSRPVEQPAPDRDAGAEQSRPVSANLVVARPESVDVIRSGLAVRVLRQVADPVAVRRLWSRTPLRALMMTSPLLPYLADVERWDLAELDDDERLLLGEVPARCSPSASAVLAGAPLVPEVRAVDALSAEGRALPGPHRLDLGPADAELIARWRTALPPDLQNPGDAPLVCALLARLAAHGDRTAAAVEERLRPAWLRMAHRAPHLIGNDLVIAEFLVTRPRSAGVDRAVRRTS